MMRKTMPVIALASLSLAGASPAIGRDDSPSQQQGGMTSESNEEVMITLQVPLDSPLFSKTPVAVVEDEPITLGDLTRGIATIHARRLDEATAPKRDYRDLLERMITSKLVVQEGRNMGLDELPEIEAQIDSFSTQLLISSLMWKQLEGVEADPAEVNELYRKMSREFDLTSVKFRNEGDALSFEKQYKDGADFHDLARRFAEKGRAEIESGGEQYMRLKDLLPEIAEAAFDMEVGSVSQIFTARGGFLVFCVEDVRFYEDDAVREQAREIILGPLKKEKAREYSESLEAKYATIDEEVLESVDLVARKKGFLWFAKEKPVDFEELLADERVVATVQGDDPFTVTVGDLAAELEKEFFHGIDKALEERKDLNRKKETVLHNMLFKRIARMEAVSRGLDEREGYLGAVDQYTDSLLFETFIAKVVGPDVKISEEEVREYYNDHIDEFSSPRMFRMNGLAFYELRDAQKALDKLEKGADFRWVSANTAGQVDKETEGIDVFDNVLLSSTALPEELRELAEGANEGDSVLYSSPDGYHYAIYIKKVFPVQREPFESARAKIAKIIYDEKVKKLLDDWSRELREAYETRIFATSFGD